MQKITLKERTEELKQLLNSESVSSKILDLHSKYVNTDFQSNSSWEELKRSLLVDLLNSKSNFDNIIQKSSDFKIISDSLNSTVYETDNFSRVISIISNTDKNAQGRILTNGQILDLICYHYSIIGLNNVTLNAFTENTNKENGVLFSILSVSNPTTNTVISVLKSIQELVDVIERINDEEQTNEIYILDKGSNTNIGVETGVKTAASIFNIFKEVWDWIVNRKYYKEKLKNAAFLENLSIIQKIHSMKEEGSITNEDALRYRTIITRNIDSLLNLDTIPRELAKLKEGNVDNILLLKDYSEIRLLEEPKKESES